MQIHADLTQRVAIDTRTLDWVDSPSRGVQRKMLDRDGAEVARATSIVRYAAGSSFPTHRHDLGEELFVIDGDLQDEAGSHGPGTFIRNPPGSSHAPGSVGGCTLFVKLRHVHPEDLQQVRAGPRNSDTWIGEVSAPIGGVSRRDRSIDDEKTPQEPLSRLQGEGGLSRREGRANAGAAG